MLNNGLPSGPSAPPSGPPAPSSAAASAAAAASSANQPVLPVNSASSQNTVHGPGNNGALPANNGAAAADQVTLLARRMDSLADTMNGLMRALTPLLAQGQVPNLTGWPQASSQAPASNPNLNIGGNPQSAPVGASAAATSQTGGLAPASGSGAPGGSAPPSVANSQMGLLTASGAGQSAAIGVSGQRPAGLYYAQQQIATNRFQNSLRPPGPPIFATTAIQPNIQFQQPPAATLPSWANHSTPASLPLVLPQPNQGAQGPPGQPSTPTGQGPHASYMAPASSGQGNSLYPAPSAFTAAFTATQNNAPPPTLHTPQHYQAGTSKQAVAPIPGPRGDAYDTEDDVFSAASAGSESATSRGRGRVRVHRRTRQEREQTRDPDSEPDDPNDDYAENRQSHEKNPRGPLEIKEYNSSGKVDFDIWVGKYEVAVNHGKNPHSKRRHHRYCLKMLPMYLDADAYVIWKRSAHRKTDWELLKKELRREFEDPIIRSEWKGNLRSYVWDESKETLHTYCSKVKRYVDTFESELEDGSRAKLDQYYLRFKSGLPDDYQDQVRMAMPTHKQSIDKAYDVCLRYQATKKGKTPKSDLAAAVSFEDPSMPARVTQNESNIIRLKNRLSKLEQAPTPAQVEQKQQRPDNKYAGNSPRRLPSRGSTSDANSEYSRSTDRVTRFRNWRKNNPRDRYSNKGQQGQQKSSGHSRSTSNSVSRHSSNESRVSQTDVESGTEGHDDTVKDFAAYLQEEEEQLFADFCAMTDEARALSTPGNG